MKGCARFLNFLALLVFLLLLVCTVAVGGLTVVIGVRPDLIPAEVFDALQSIPLNIKPITMEMLAGYRTPCLIILGILLLNLILGLVEVANIRTALKEVSHEQPFSFRCSKALNTACILVVLGGLLEIGLSVYSSYIFGGLTVDGSSVTHFSTNLSFIPIAVLLKMLSGISEFGRG